MQLLLDVPLAGVVVGQSDDASEEPVAGRVLREVKLGCCCGRSYLVRCSGNKNSWTLWVKHRPDALVLDLLWSSCPFFLTGRLHVWPLKPCDLWEPQFERNRKSLQSCRLSVSTWDEACWGGTGRCLGPRLMEPSTTAGPRTDPACWSLVGSTPNPRYFSSIFKWVCGLFCASPFKQREKTK